MPVNKRTRDILITVALIVVAIVVSMRFGRSLPENQPDRNDTIKSMVGDWAVTGASDDGIIFDFPNGLPGLTVDSDDSWESATDCAVFAGTVTFDGADPIEPQATGVVGFEPVDVEGLSEMGCDDVEVLVGAMVEVDRWEWRGGDMRFFSENGDAEFTISPVL